MDDGKQESGSGEPGAEVSNAENSAHSFTEGSENAEKLTVNTEGGETKLENSAGEDLPEAGPVTGLINANSNIADLEKKSTEEPEGGSDESSRVTEGEEIAPTDAVLMAEVEVTSIEHNGAAGDKHGYTVRVKPTPGAYHHPYEFSLGMITSHGAKKLAIGKKYRITVTEA